MLVGGWFDLSCMAASVLIFILLWRAGGERVLGALVPVGRMTLTLYVGQSLVFIPLFYPLGLRLYERITPSSPWPSASPAWRYSWRWRRPGSRPSTTARWNGCGGAERGCHSTSRSAASRSLNSPRADETWLLRAETLIVPANRAASAREALISM